MMITELEQNLYDRGWQRAGGWLHRLNGFIGFQPEMLGSALFKIKNEEDLTEICLGAIECLPLIIASGKYSEESIERIKRLLETVKTIDLNPAIVEQVKAPNLGNRYIGR